MGKKITIRKLKELLYKEGIDRVRRNREGYTDEETGDDYHDVMELLGGDRVEEDQDRVRRHNDGYGDDLEEGEDDLPTQKKAKKIMKHGEVKGHELSDKQKGFFGMLAGGEKPTRMKEEEMPDDSSELDNSPLGRITQKAVDPVAHGQHGLATPQKKAMHAWQTVKKMVGPEGMQSLKKIIQSDPDFKSGRMAMPKLGDMAKEVNEPSGEKSKKKEFKSRSSGG